MNFRATAVMFLALLLPAGAQQPGETSALLIVTQSQESLDKHDQKEALRLVLEGLVRFPDDEELELQLARIFVYQKHDLQAMDKINSVLRRNPSSRNAKLALAQIYGYHDDFKKSDAIYRELLAMDAEDEAAAVGLIHNLLLEGQRLEAREQLQQALRRHPTSLVLQQYNDLLTSAAAAANGEAREETHARVQAGEEFFSDSSGNRSLYSAQAFTYKISRNLSSRARLDETSLWKTATPTLNVYSGSQDLSWKINRFFGLRASGGVVRFADDTSQALYSGDLEVYPLKNLLLTGGYSRFPVAPTFDAVGFDLLSEGWHGRADYRTKNFSVYGSLYLTHYSDGNYAERESGEVMRWFGSNGISVGGGYAFRHIRFQEELNHGYFSPNQYLSQLGAAGLRLSIGRVYHGEFLGNLGGEKINAGRYTTAGEFLLRNQFFLHRWEFDANYSHHQLVQSTAAFRADLVSGSVGYRF